MKKRSHKNTTRLTARERAQQVASDVWVLVPKEGGWGQAQDVIERALQAHARQALARRKARAS